jgi:hypothetical protein
VEADYHPRRIEFVHDHRTFLFVEMLLAVMGVGITVETVPMGAAQASPHAIS